MHRLDGASPQEITGAGCGLLARYIESAGSHRCQGIYIGAGEKKLCLPAVLFSEKSPKHPCPFSAHSEISNNSPCIPQVLFRVLLPCCSLEELFVMLFL